MRCWRDWSLPHVSACCGIWRSSCAAASRIISGCSAIRTGRLTSRGA
nr:MAG TPA: hypothetical protein [Caudoviricetes sp.]